MRHATTPSLKTWLLTVAHSPVTTETCWYLQWSSETETAPPAASGRRTPRPGRERRPCRGPAGLAAGEDAVVRTRLSARTAGFGPAPLVGRESHVFAAPWSENPRGKRLLPSLAQQASQ